jgi:DNA-nicking Smr family endonuclease
VNKRVTSDDERRLFEQDFREARPLKPAAGKKSKMRKSAAGPSGVNGATEERLRKGQIEPDAKLDLHGMTEAAAHRALLRFLEGAVARRNRLILVVTGKGNPRKEEAAPWMQSSHGALKQMVPRWLNEPDAAALIASVRPAHVRHGGGGALYVYLRKPR